MEGYRSLIAVGTFALVAAFACTVGAQNGQPYTVPVPPGYGAPPPYNPNPPAPGYYPQPPSVQPPAPAPTPAPPPSDEDRAFYYGHFSGGVVAASLAMVGKSDKELYLGLSVLPEGRLAVTLDRRDNYRLFFAGRYTGLSVLTSQGSGKDSSGVERASDLEAMGILGLSFRVFGEHGDAKVETAARRLSLGLGYGNFRYKVDDSDTYVQGMLFCVSVDVDALAFNFVPWD